MSARDPGRRPFYWEGDPDTTGKWSPPPGAELAALRRGIGREAGDVPEMWRHYTLLRADGWLSPELKAEHVALTLYAVHQQSKSESMHQPDIGLGTAMRALWTSGKFSEEAVNRRFTAAATATDFRELSLHLRGLVTQLRTVGQPLDYTKLHQDLLDWHYPESLRRVRRRWGGEYFTPAGSDKTDGGKTDGDTTGANPTVPKQPRRPSETATTSIQETR